MTGIHLALGVTAILMSATVLVLRGEEASVIEAANRRDAREGSLCVGVDHPDISSGLVCAASVEQVVPLAVERLALPTSCSRIRLSHSIDRGDRIAFQQEQGHCMVERITPLSAGHRLLSGAGLDINVAGADALSLLPGIGEIKARAIVEHRRIHGPFSSLEALDEVSGIGEKTVERLRPWLTMTPRSKYSFP